MLILETHPTKQNISKLNRLVNQDCSEACRQESKVSHSFCESSQGGISEFFFCHRFLTSPPKKWCVFQGGCIQFHGSIFLRHQSSADLFPAMPRFVRFLNPIIFEPKRKANMFDANTQPFGSGESQAFFFTKCPK